MSVIHRITPEIISTSSPLVGNDLAIGCTFHDGESSSRVHRSSVNVDAQTPTVNIETGQTSFRIPKMVEDGIHSQGSPKMEFLAVGLTTEAHKGGHATKSPVVMHDSTELDMSMVPITAQNRPHMLTRRCAFKAISHSDLVALVRYLDLDSYNA
ncbi:hypothetical protein V6N13_092799 [Hibiscus sabdariffa]|uniref:Uncharacterized protein n=1 Tax=Hibiscus sabdariffa TaxID=183260 RepID=A0ABR2AHL4_9ROSI